MKHLLPLLALLSACSLSMAPDLDPTGVYDGEYHADPGGHRAGEAHVVATSTGLTYSSSAAGGYCGALTFTLEDIEEDGSRVYWLEPLNCAELDAQVDLEYFLGRATVRLGGSISIQLRTRFDGESRLLYFEGQRREL